ncbi:MAG: lysoplasmalogenase, partial [Bacteroidota bacterium]
MALILDHPSIPLYTKPLIMILLIGWFLHSIKLRLNRFSILMVVAFLFSLGGDVALMMQHDPAYQMYPMFLLGLSSFLIAQLNYAVAFHTYPSEETGFLRRWPLMAVPFIVFWGWINRYLWADLANFQIPVLVYSAVITLMALSCLNASTRLHHAAFRRMFIGVVLFLCSDALIALSRFATNLEVPDA